MQTIATRHFLVALFVLLGTLLSAQTSFAIDGEISVVIEPGTDSHFVSYGGALLVDFEPPEHGNLIPANNGFHYEPNETFWAVGHDIVLMEVTLRSGLDKTFRYILAAGSLTLDGNTVYSTNPNDPGDWNSTAPMVPGTVDPNAYEVDVDPNNPQPPMMSIDDPNASGHQQTSEHVVNVTVDDLDFNRFPNLPSNNEITYYKVRQGSDIILELRAHFDQARSVWQVKAYGEGGSSMNYIDVTQGFYQTKLVRWGKPGGESGANFYINNQHLGSITGLSYLLTAPITYELALDQSPAHAGMFMRFEDPLVTTGIVHGDLASRKASDSFDGESAGSQTVSTDWDVVEGATYMSFSPQTLAGNGDQLDIDLGAVPHWEHAYVRQNFSPNPLSNYKMRFWMDTSQVNIPEGHVMRMVYACRDSETDWCVDFRLFLTRTNGQLELGLDVWDDGGVAQTLTTPIAEGPQVVELQYETSQSATVATGWVEMWVDGLSVGTFQGLSNYHFTIEDIRIGTLYTSSTITGTFSLDEIITWTRQ